MITGHKITEYHDGRIVRFTSRNAVDEIINSVEYVYSGSNYTMTESYGGTLYRKQEHTVAPEIETYEEYLYNGKEWIFSLKVVTEYELTNTK